MKNKVLVILGPTATGKSDLAVRIAKKFNGEIISADSRQVYKGLDIGTGKITKKEMQSVPHHLLDVVNPKEIFTVSDYKALGLKTIKSIVEKNKLPIIVGGTGFYIDALVGTTSLPQVLPNKKLREKLEKKSTEELFKLLKIKDPNRARTIDQHNKVRLVRALEIIEALGKVPKIKKEKSPYEFIFIGLSLPQDDLDRKIKKRLLDRLNQGMIEEAKKLRSQKLSFKRMHNLGLEYRYVALFLQNKLSLEEMTEKLFKEIRSYSKRQMTWFRKNKKIKWFDPREAASVLDYVAAAIQTKQE